MQDYSQRFPHVLCPTVCVKTAANQNALLPVPTSRSDTVRYALDILAILMVVPKVQLVLADTVEVLDETRSPVSTVGQ